MDRIRLSLVFTALISAAMASVAPPAASGGANGVVMAAQTGFQSRLPERQVQTMLSRIRTDADALRRLVDARGSYRQTLDHLRAHGVEVLEKPRNLTPWAQLYVCDPDGNVIELNADILD